MVALRSRQTSTGKASGSGRQARLTRYLPGECYAREDNATAVQAQEGKDPPDAGRYLADVANGHAKPDQYGRGRYDLGRGSAHASCRQIFLRRGDSRMRRYGILLFCTAVRTDRRGSPS